MTTHIEDTGIEVRATEVPKVQFGGSYAGIGIDAEENWVQPYYTFVPEDMSAYTNAPSEINGIIMTKMKSKDGIEDKFGIELEGTQGICADVQEEIYASTYALLSPIEKYVYNNWGKPLSFIPDDNPGNTPDSNPVLQSAGWLPVDPAINITSAGNNYYYEPLALYVPFDEPLAGDDERYKGVYYCKLLSHQAVLSWFLSKSLEADPVLITPSAIECTDPRYRTETTYGSCLFWFSQGDHFYCSDYIGPDFIPEGASEAKCASRSAEAVYSSETCSTRDANGEIEAYITATPRYYQDRVPPTPRDGTLITYDGLGASCDIHCLEGDEFLWNLYEPNVGEADCGNFPIFYP
jgi:hypothetical protein